MIEKPKNRHMFMYAWVPSGGQEMSSLSSERGGLLGGMAAISYLLMVELSFTPAR